MKANELRQKYIDFFTESPRSHKQIPSVSLIPEDDPTILFTPAGMSPLVRYLMGESHPLGKRLCSVQKCVRVDDIEEVGDLTHFTFFEMLGNWSLGDYFKKEAIEWSFEFLTNKKWLGLNPEKIYISVFKGDKDAHRDEESIAIWQEVFRKRGVKAQLDQRIFVYPKKQNWWGPAGQTGPCGPSTEMFYDTGKSWKGKCSGKCHPNCDCGRMVEIWNDVFMEYNKTGENSFQPLKQKNVDTGMGLERVVALTEWLDGKIKEPDPFLTHLFSPVINKLEKQSGKSYQNYQLEFRIIADHLRAIIFMIIDGVEPSNKDRGYILRRLLRRAIFYAKHNLGIQQLCVELLSANFLSIYWDTYKELKEKQVQISKVITEEEEKFLWTINKGLSEFEKIKVFDGQTAFFLYESYGFPIELSFEEAKKRKFSFDRAKVLKEFNQKMKNHQEISRKGMKQKFSGGLQDQSTQVVKLHTATHMLHAALRQVLGKHIQQIGSNITTERLRFDFIHPEKLTQEQKEKIETLVNEQIKNNLKVECRVMSLKDAQKQGALAFFGQKYPEKVKVFSIGKSSKDVDKIFSKEVCGGPHVDFTGQLGTFKIIKEESSGANKRRIYAVLK